MPGHVFLSHAGLETDLARELKRALERARPQVGRSCEVWLDVERLGQEREWVSAIERAIEEASAFVVLVDKLPLRNWVTEEVKLAIRRDVELGAEGPFTVIPVLGPNATSDALKGQFLGSRPAILFSESGDWRQVADEVLERIHRQGAEPSYALEADESQPSPPSPFRGLAAFGPQDGHLFHGRANEVQRLVLRLRDHHLVPVIGNSGSGKSSLVLAGLIPALLRGRFQPPSETPRSWRPVILRPGDQPWENLISALCHAARVAAIAGQPPAALKLELRDYCSRSERPIHDMVEAASNPGEQVLLVVDQLEELIRGPEGKPAPIARKQAERFIRSLVDALGEQGNRWVKMVTTLRTDYLEEIVGLGFEDFANASQDSWFPVRLPDPVQLRNAIVGPTYLTRRRFKPALVDRLIQDAGTGAGSLALLQFALSELWEVEGQEIGLEQYEQVGRLAGALNRHADGVLAKIPSADHDLVRRMMLNLCVPGDASGHTRKSATKQELLGGRDSVADRERLLEVLIKARLVVSRESGSANVGDTRYEVPHEELLRSWRTMEEWIRKGADDLRLARRLEARRLEWLQDHRDVLTPGQLEEALAWVKRDPDGPSAELQEFFEACEAHHRAQADRERELGRRVAGAEDLRALTALRAEAGNLWPPYPEQIPALEAWVMRAKDLLDRLPAHRQALVELQGLAERSPLLEETYSELVAGLVRLADPKHGLLDGIDLGQNPQDETGEGLGIRRRLDFARSVTERTVSGEEARRRWGELLLDFQGKAPEAFPLGYRDELNRSLAFLQPIVGLIPWRKDPKSGLWELLHLFSGDFPETGPNGEFVQTPATGIILVLIPGGTFWMGAQKEDPNGQNYDPGAQSDEGPVHPVACPPFLIAKTTITQAQWTRMRGSNPSQYRADNLASFRVTDTNPVETVSWQDGQLWLPRFGLSLPSEARWERAARAGTDTPWCTGMQRELLANQVNLADKTSASHGVGVAEAAQWPDFDDGFAVHAPAAEFGANAFGLHQVHGNVQEWCEDNLSGNNGEARKQHPEAFHVKADPFRVLRGGCFGYGAGSARSAYRFGLHPGSRASALGFRPAVLIP